jgi:hypothetical protein
MFRVENIHDFARRLLEQDVTARETSHVALHTSEQRPRGIGATRG